MAESIRLEAGAIADRLGASSAFGREELLIAEGDLVRLKAGGPIMVVKFKIATLLLCVWTNRQGRTQRETFAPGQLELIRHDSPAWLLALSRLSSRWHVVSTF
jgi:uncharacterized protein YodC (DUF2158 family)